MATFEQMGVNGLFENLLRQIEAPMNMDVKVTQQTSPENMKGMKEAPNIAPSAFGDIHFSVCAMRQEITSPVQFFLFLKFFLLFLQFFQSQHLKVLLHFHAFFLT